MSKTKAKIVQTGSWMYDGTVAMPVYIVRANYDFFFELAKEESQLEPDEKPALNADGFLFYVSFKGIDADGRFWPDSGGDPTMAAARAQAESRVPSAVKWESA